MQALLCHVCSQFVLTYAASDPYLPRSTPVWKTWNHGDGMTSTYRQHLQTAHSREWTKEVLQQGLKGANKVATQLGSTGQRVEKAEEHPPFTVERFQKLLMMWIVADDQVSCIKPWII
jgi:hypothetical protein